MNSDLLLILMTFSSDTQSFQGLLEYLELA